MPRRDDDDTVRQFFEPLHKALERLAEFARELGEHKVECKGNQQRIETKLNELHHDHQKLRRWGFWISALALLGILLGPGALLDYALSQYGIQITFSR